MNELKIIALLIPIGICVVVPIAITWIVCRAYSNRDNKQAEILMEAIRSNNNVDTDKLANAFAKKEKTPQQHQSRRLLCGCIFTFFGVLFMLVSIIMMCVTEISSDWGSLLVLACLSLPVGISYLIVYFVSKKQVAAGVEPERQ